MTSEPTWSEAFAAYLDNNGITQQQASFDLRVSQSRVHYWKHGSEPRGKKGEKMKRRIERWSKGGVPSGLPPTERRLRKATQLVDAIVNKPSAGTNTGTDGE